MYPRITAKCFGAPVRLISTQIGLPASICSLTSLKVSGFPLVSNVGWGVLRVRYRTAQIRAGTQLLTAQDPFPNDLNDALANINRLRAVH